MTLTSNIMISVFDEQAVEQEVFANKGFSQVSMITLSQYFSSHLAVFCCKSLNQPLVGSFIIF